MANHTADLVSVVDVRARRVRAEISVGRRPSHLTLSADGSELYVSCLWDSRVDVVDLRSQTVVRSLPVGWEPYGTTASQADDLLIVANSLSDHISAVDPRTGAARWTVSVGRSPRSVAPVPGSPLILVANGLSRNATLVSSTTGDVRETRDLGRASILREAACTPDGRFGLVTHVVSHDEQVTTQLERGWIHSNGISVMDLARPGHRVTVLLDELLRGAANPWGIVLAPDGRRGYVSLSGTHEIAYLDLPALIRLVEATPPERVKAMEEDVEALHARGIMRRLPCGGLGPRGIALAREGRELLVSNYFSSELTILDAESGTLLGRIPLGRKRPESLWRRGERLFNDGGLCFQTWFSCASCHQEDATIDALNWDLLNDGAGNAKNVKSLHDIADTPPAMWSSVREDVLACTAAGQRFSGFLPQPANQAALVEYISRPVRAPNPHRSGDAEPLRRGERAFYRASCDVCHPPPTYTDQKSHDLGLAADDPHRSKFDTPSLRECYRTGPYLHGGSAARLEDVFRLRDDSRRHGDWRVLSSGEFDDLISFLRSL